MIVLTMQIYHEIVDVIDEWDSCNKDLEYALSSKYNLPARTVASIISINFVRRMKETHFRLCKHSDEIWLQYQAAVSTNEEVGILFRLSEKYRSSPALMAKVVLEQYLLHTKNSTFSADDEIDTRVDSEIGRKDETKGQGESKRKTLASQMLRDSSLINDGRLAKEILLCKLSDYHYGPISELYNRSIGEEFEGLLQKKAREAGLSVESEVELRCGGYDKTPDLKLNVPVAVDGFVINWIESKGLFGDVTGHRSYISEQYSSYWNRFGPGLVIYWLGCEETILDPLEKRFIVRSAFPDNITQMQPLLAADLTSLTSVSSAPITTAPF